MPMLFRFRFQHLGGHTHIRVFTGLDQNSLGLCGSLAMRIAEWHTFRGLTETMSTAAIEDGSVRFEFLPEHENSLAP